MLLNIGGVRAVVTEDKCLLFEPNSPSSRKFLEIVMPKIQAAGGGRRRGGGLTWLGVGASEVGASALCAGWAVGQWLPPGRESRQAGVPCQTARLQPGLARRQRRGQAASHTQHPACAMAAP